MWTGTALLQGVRIFRLPFHAYAIASLKLMTQWHAGTPYGKRNIAGCARIDFMLDRYAIEVQKTILTASQTLEMTG